MIKLVAFDVDGTLRDREYLPKSTRRALHTLKEHGITLALCTGRSEYEMKALWTELEIDWAVTCNGSHIGHQGKTVFDNPFSRETVQDWLELAERLNHTLLLYGAELMFTNRANDPHFLQAQKEIGFMEPVLLKDGDEVPNIYQCIVFCNEEDEAHYVKGERSRYYIHRWRPWAVDINPNGMHKALGLQKLLDHLNLMPQEVAAFGDGLNDLELLESVGMGIAMGNGGELLKKKARFVTKPLREDGIEYAVHKWIIAPGGEL
ncbi:Cof-type HAD-IIB family hydrolase [Paenibacillus xerothermodurans]|nr:Cof-type HAD-IIB family hydrolase [Paenibacillus xerothermodurans]